MLFRSDPGCSSPTDASEIDGACDDLVNNDFDSLTDYPSDTGCTSYSDSSELGTTQCDDGLDNDGDGHTDYHPSTGDSECTSGTDDSESPMDNCYDSDFDYMVAGYVVGYDGGNYFNNSDSCQDAVTVREWGCNNYPAQGYDPSYDDFDCSLMNATCSNGACV